MAFLLYKNRDIETASDVVAISCIKPVFRWCGGIGAAGVCTYLVWESLLSGMVGNMFWLVLVCSSVAGAAGFFLCEMLIRKKFMVFTGKRLAEGGVFLAVLAAALVCMETDLFGVEKRVPAAEEVTCMGIIKAIWRNRSKSASELKSIRSLSRKRMRTKRISGKIRAWKNAPACLSGFLTS